MHIQNQPCIIRVATNFVRSLSCLLTFGLVHRCTPQNNIVLNDDNDNDKDDDDDDETVETVETVYIVCH